MMIKTILALSVVALFSLSSPVAASGSDKAAAGAAKFIEKMGNTAIPALTEKEISSREREKRARDILRANFDVPAIGRYAMGTYWREASDPQRKEYLDLFEDMIVKTYAQRFAEYSGQEFKVAGALKASEKDSTVSSQIIQKDGPTVNVDWRVRQQKDGGYKVIDVVVEGISMSITQRSDFVSVIQRNNGDINALISSLRLRKNGAIAEKL